MPETTHQTVGFLVGYADVDDQLVWDVITTNLSIRQEEVGALLGPTE
jgi:uncharacterized protein with HEPN domain